MNVQPITVSGFLSVDVVVVVAGGFLYSSNLKSCVGCHGPCVPKRSMRSLVVSYSISSSTCSGGGKICLRPDIVLQCGGVKGIERTGVMLRGSY